MTTQPPPEQPLPEQPLSRQRLSGLRVLITSADTYMGPAIAELFAAEGADLITDSSPLTAADAPAALIAEATADAPLDAVVINLDREAYTAKAVDIQDEPWLEGFDSMVHPLMRTVRAAAPPMIERGAGALVAVTSSSPLRRMSPQAISYVTARAAQNAFVRSAGHDLARHGVRLNAIAQNFVANDTYYPPEIMENEKFVRRLRNDVPAGRLGQPEETAELALFLATDASSFIMGQILSQDGGWS